MTIKRTTSKGKQGAMKKGLSWIEGGPVLKSNNTTRGEKKGRERNPNLQMKRSTENEGPSLGGKLQKRGGAIPALRPQSRK